MHTITIAGKPFQVQPRYSAGHVLTDNEASTLNQTFFENIRNNFAGKAKEGGTQDDLDKYVADYSFGVRSGGSRDPIEVEAMELARDAVRKLIVKQGKKISEYSAKAISEAAAKLLDKKPEYRELAKERVAQMQNVASESLDEDMLASLNEAQAQSDAEDAESEEGQTEGNPESGEASDMAAAGEAAAESPDATASSDDAPAEASGGRRKARGA